MLSTLAFWCVTLLSPDPDGAAPRGAAVSVPLLAAHGLLYVELQRSGDTLLALLDTGASASAIETRRAPELPVLERTEAVGTTGVLPVEMVLVEDLALDSLELPALRATRRDLSGLLEPEEGRAVDMILGSDAFSGLAVTLDYGSGSLEVAVAGDSGAGGFPMQLEAGIPAIQGQLGGVDVWLRIDTGASLFETSDVYVNVPASTWRDLCRRHPGIVPTSVLQGTGADGKVVDLPVAEIPGARIGPLELQRVFVIVQPEIGYFATPGARGFVSNNFLRKLGRVTLDYRSGRLRTP